VLIFDTGMFGAIGGGVDILKPPPGGAEGTVTACVAGPVPLSGCDWQPDNITAAVKAMGSVQ
jgi:hypothetical protein